MDLKHSDSEAVEGNKNRSNPLYVGLLRSNRTIKAMVVGMPVIYVSKTRK